MAEAVVMADLLASACSRAGFTARGARLLRAHSNSVFYLPDENVVARVNTNEHSDLRARESVAITRCLADQGIPVTEPVTDPVDIDTFTVTFWRFYPQDDRGTPPARHLGAILRDLHALPQPPFNLPEYLPLAGLTEGLATDSVLAPEDRQWLIDQSKQLIDQYHGLESTLGWGMVHGDAYSGNTLWDGQKVRLGDWDETSLAPRELDLINTFHSTRFGTPTSELDQFAETYGFDPRSWSGFEALRTMRDLHTLSSYLTRANQGDHAAHAELTRRINIIRNPGKNHAVWRSVP